MLFRSGMPQMVGEFVLKKNGVQPKTDLELIQNIDFGNIPSAFIAGTGDYVQLFEPTATIFEEEGKGTIVASFGEASGFVPYTAFMTKTSYLQAQQEVVESFTRAIFKAQQFVEKNTLEVLADSVQPYFKETDLETIMKVVDRYRAQDTYATNPIIDEQEWNNLLSIMKEAGVIQKDAPYGELVNTEIAQTVMK